VRVRHDRAQARWDVGRMPPGPDTAEPNDPYSVQALLRPALVGCPERRFFSASRGECRSGSHVSFKEITIRHKNV
jgi:hypothetical protein